MQPKKALHTLRLANAYMAGKDSTSAASALRLALEIEPDNLMAQPGLALLAVLNKRPAEGITIARHVQQRQPKQVVGFALEGELQSKLGNWSAAASAYAAALQRGKSTDFAIRLHRSFREDGKAAQANRITADWRVSNPKDGVFLYDLGDTASAAKDWAKAEQQYRAVLALQPRHAAALNNIAWLLASQRRPAATAMAEQANALLPERAPLLDTLALALEAENQLPKAMQTQQRAVALDPKDPMLRLRLAQLFIKQGNKPGAREVLESLARLGSTFAGQAEVAGLLKTL